MPMALLFLLALKISASPVLFSAQRVVFLQNPPRVYLSGHARISSGTTTLEADSVIYWPDAHLLRAFRHFVLVVQKDTLQGDSLYYNVTTQRGMAFGGRGKVEKGYLYGEVVYRVSEDEYWMKNGRYTTCDAQPPHYYFASPRMRATRNDMAVASPVVFRLLGIPVLELPFWYFPVGGGRRSGLLTPRYGRSGADGFYLRNLAYYWAINNYMDLTVSLNLIERRGIQMAFSLPYVVYKRFRGKLAGTWANDLVAGHRRWSLEGNHNQQLANGARITGQLQYVSDVNYLQDYSEDKEEWLRGELHSFLSYTHTWRNLLHYSLSADERRDLARGTHVITFPRISSDLFSIRYGNLDASSRVNFVGGKDADSLPYRWVAWANPSLAWPFRWLRYLQVRPSVNLTATLYDRDTTGRPRARAVPSVQVQMSTVIYGLSRFRIGPVERILQTLKPRLTFTYIPSIDQGWIDPFRGNGPIAPVRRGSFSLSNDYEVKFRRGGRTQKIPVLASGLNVSYNLENPPGERLSAVQAYARWFPGKPSNARLSATWDPYERRITHLQINSTLAWRFRWGPEGFHADTTTSDTTLADTVIPGEGAQGTEEPARETLRWSVRIQHTYQWRPSRRNFFTLSLSGNPTRRWQLSYRLSYDAVQQRVMSQSLSLQRDLHCFQAQFRWSSFGGSWIYDFRIWIKALPDIKVQRSFLEALLPG